MTLFERYLTAWVALCMVAGVFLGHLFPVVFQAIGAAEVAQVNLPLAILIWLMIIPMLIKIDFAALGAHARHVGYAERRLVDRSLFRRVPPHDRQRFGRRVVTGL